MERIKRTIIETVTIETAAVTVESFDLNCAICGPGAAMLSLAGARLSSGFAYSRLLEMADADSVHYVETPGGHVLICRDSIQKIKTIQGATDHEKNV